MLRIFIISLSLLCLCVKSASAQKNYFEYHKIIQKAENYLIDSAFNKAVKTYKKAYQKFDKTFVRDDINAMVCALIENDYESALFFDKRRILKNTPLPPLMEEAWKKYQESDIYLRAGKEMDSLKQYGEKLRQNSRLTFLYDSLAEKDQAVRKNPNYINGKDTTILITDSLNLIETAKLLSEKGYPTDIERGKQQSSDIILRHNTMYSQGTLLPLVLEEVKKGNYGIYEYTFHYDTWYMHWQSPKSDDREVKFTHFLTGTFYGGVWAIVNDKLYQQKHSREDTKRINANRKALGLETLEQAYRTQYFSTRDKRFLFKNVISVYGHGNIEGTRVELFFRNILPKHFELVPLYKVGRKFIEDKNLTE